MYQQHKFTLILKEWLTEKSKTHPGQLFSYDAIEYETGVKMDSKGKARLRQSAKYVNVEFATIHGHGIEIAGAHNGMEIVGRHLVKIDRATRRAEKSVKNITDKYFLEMSEDDKKSIAYLGAAFGAIRSHADSFKILIKKTPIIAVNTGAI
jgi:hypothetical protein